jgi:hypothetical protein
MIGVPAVKDVGAFQLGIQRLHAVFQAADAGFGFSAVHVAAGTGPDIMPTGVNQLSLGAGVPYPLKE